MAKILPQIEHGHRLLGLQHAYVANEKHTQMVFYQRRVQDLQPALFVERILNRYRDDQKFEIDEELAHCEWQARDGKKLFDYHTQKAAKFIGRQVLGAEYDAHLSGEAYPED
jgi:hypothetical protein